MNFINSIVNNCLYNDFEFFVKRDDLIHKDFSGNKARKFYYFLNNDLNKFKKIISYGSNQSNAMYSLSVLAKLKQKEFTYYTNHIPSFLKENPDGNYKAAIENGMNIVEGEPPANILNDELFISEGGAIKQAQYGIKILADEINTWAKKNNKSNINIFLPSGTGTTALYLQKNLDMKVFTTPCVGDNEYLKKQFLELEDEKFHPTIIKPDKKYHFGKLYKQNYELYLDIKNKTNIEFDLLYDPIGLKVMFENFKSGEVLYIHQGGIKGNETMIKRYERKL